MSITYLDGLPDNELNFDFRRIFLEECGLFFGFNIADATFNGIRALRAQEPRGERGAGIISYDGKDFYRRTRVGKVSVQFSGFDMKKCRQEFPGRLAVGHNRYATAGKADAPENVQPFLRHTKWGEIVVAHNGTFVNADSLRKELLLAGRVLSTTSDTEMFFNLLTLSGEEDL
jgi:amidophosphoribosyltransferase